MDNLAAVLALGALAQPTRLETFRLLVGCEPEGLPAGDISRRVGTPQNTMSSHLSILARAGLVRSDRRSRCVVYRAEIDRLRDLLLFLAKDCCGGRPELCGPLMADLAPCCGPEKILQ